MPVSSTSSATGAAPAASSQSLSALRRPAATTVRSAVMVLPSARCTPLTCGTGASVDEPGSVSNPSTPTPVRNVTRPSASAARRSTHSNVVRRQASITSSSSAASRSKLVMVSGRSSPKRISVAPSERSDA